MASKIDNLINQLHVEKEYRPVSVGVLYREGVDSREFLVVQSAKALKVWMFPQGGIDPGESLKDNLSRELGEELGINFDADVMNVRFAYYYEVLDAESTRKDKRGFSRGKAYIFTLGQYVGNGNFNLQEDEVADAKWVNYEEALRHFDLGRVEKAALSKRGLDGAIKILEK